MKLQFMEHMRIEGIQKLQNSPQSDIGLIQQENVHFTLKYHQPQHNKPWK